MNGKSNVALAFLHGLTGAGLFRRLDYPGAPTEFIDSRSYEEFAQSNDCVSVSNLSQTVVTESRSAQQREDGERTKRSSTAARAQSTH